MEEGKKLSLFDRTVNVLWVIMRSVLIFLVTLGAIAWLFLDNKLHAEYRVRGTVPRARVDYVTAVGTKSEEVRLPWAFDLDMNKGRPIRVIASNNLESGELICEIVVSGQIWRSSSDTGYDLRVECRGAAGAD